MDLFFLFTGIYAVLFLINTALATFNPPVYGYKKHILFGLGVVPIAQIISIIIFLYYGKDSNNTENAENSNTY